MNNKSKEIGTVLISFYEMMQGLEKDSEKSGKQATMLIMAINDIEEIYEPKNSNPYARQKVSNVPPHRHEFTQPDQLPTGYGNSMQTVFRCNFPGCEWCRIDSGLEKY